MWVSDTHQPILDTFMSDQLRTNTFHYTQVKFVTAILTGCPWAKFLNSADIFSQTHMQIVRITPLHEGVVHTQAWVFTSSDIHGGDEAFLFFTPTCRRSAGTHQRDLWQSVYMHEVAFSSSTGKTHAFPGQFGLMHQVELHLQEQGRLHLVSSSDTTGTYTYTGKAACTLHSVYDYT